MMPELRKGALFFMRTEEVPGGFRRLKRLEKMGLPPWKEGPVSPSQSSGKSLEQLGIMVLVKL